MRLHKFVAVLLAALLMLSVFAIPAFAEESSSATGSSAEVASSAETQSSANSSATNGGTDTDKKEEKNMRF